MRFIIVSGVELLNYLIFGLFIGFQGIGSWIQDQAAKLAESAGNEGAKQLLEAAADAKDFKDFISGFNEPEE